MGWDRKRRGPASGYFYLSVRTSEGIKKIYCGRGAAGQIAAAELRERREAGRTAVREAERAAAIGGDTDSLRLEDDLVAWVGVLSSAWLILSGHHKHHGCWRLKRG